MQKVNLMGQGLRSLAPVISTQERTNIFYEIRKDGEKNQVIIRPTPGLTLFTQIPTSPIRGFKAINNILYVVGDNKLFQINQFGTVALLGTLGGPGQSRLCNLTWNKTQLVIVDGINGGYYYTFTDNVGLISTQPYIILSMIPDIVALATQYAQLTGNTTQPIFIDRSVPGAHPDVAITTPVPPTYI